MYPPMLLTRTAIKRGRNTAKRIGAQVEMALAGSAIYRCWHPDCSQESPKTVTEQPYFWVIVADPARRWRSSIYDEWTGKEAALGARSNGRFGLVWTADRGDARWHCHCRYRRAHSVRQSIGRGIVRVSTRGTRRTGS